MHMQPNSQAKKIFQCRISGKKKCTKGNGVNWKPGAPLRPKINVKINDVLIIINYTVMQRIACCSDSEGQGEELPAAD